MTNLTQEQIELQQYIDLSNAKIVKEATEKNCSFFTTSVSDPVFWAEYNVFNVAQYEHFSAASFHYDFYKELNGIKPRWIDYSKMTLAEIEKEIDLLVKQQESEEKYEAELAKFEKEREEKMALANAYKPNNVFSELKNLMYSQ